MKTIILPKTFLAYWCWRHFKSEHVGGGGQKQKHEDQGFHGFVRWDEISSAPVTEKWKVEVSSVPECSTSLIEFTGSIRSWEIGLKSVDWLSNLTTGPKLLKIERGCCGLMANTRVFQSRGSVHNSLSFLLLRTFILILVTNWVYFTTGRHLFLVKFFPWQMKIRILEWPDEEHSTVKKVDKKRRWKSNTQRYLILQPLTVGKSD